MSSTSDWFTEAELPFAATGVRVSYQTRAVLFDEQTVYGHIQVLETDFLGRVLVIDGVVQVAQRDEFIYHEMLVILPTLYRDAPRSVLIIGGGDGGAAKQALRVPSLERIVQVEIDRTVVDVCATYLPTIANGALASDRVELVFTDGAAFVDATDERFDLVALDLTDPVPGGPAESLYTAAFLDRVRASLTPGGVVSLHCGSLMVQPDEAKEVIAAAREVFTHVHVHSAVIPSYQLSQFGFILASDAPFEGSALGIAAKLSSLAGRTRYLSAEVVAASRALPPYLGEVLGLA